MKKKFLIVIAVIYCLNASAQDNKDATITALRNEVKSLIRVNEELRDEINRLKSAINERDEATKSSSSKSSSQGEEYRIQIGVQNNALGSLASPKMVAGTMVNGKMVYDIGSFQNPNEAFNLSQEMRKLNLAGSFVTRYVNGIRDYSYRFDPNQPQPSYRQPTPAPKSGITYDSETGTIGRNDSKKSKSMQIED